MLKNPALTPSPAPTIGLYAIPLGLLFALTPWATSATALLLGLLIALLFGNPYLTRSRKIVRPLLAYSIVGLGAGIDLSVVAKAGLEGCLFTAFSLSATLALGWFIGRCLSTNKETSFLINVGTAICGGSAIAAVASAVGSRDHEISIALAVVFILNACALFLFPGIGHYFHLTEGQFGLWCALAIHDTSSVVGATMQYGAHALEVGTTVKLVRALWIIPVTLVVARLASKKQDGDRPPIKYPFFILGFVLISALVTFFPILHSPGHYVEWVAKHALVVTLFLIGSGITRSTLQTVGIRPLFHGCLLWIIVASANLMVAIHS